MFPASYSATSWVRLRGGEGDLGVRGLMLSVFLPTDLTGFCRGGVTAERIGRRQVARLPRGRGKRGRSRIPRETPERLFPKFADNVERLAGAGPASSHLVRAR